MELPPVNAQSKAVPDVCVQVPFEQRTKWDREDHPEPSILIPEHRNSWESSLARIEKVPHKTVDEGEAVREEQRRAYEQDGRHGRFALYLELRCEEEAKQTVTKLTTLERRNISTMGPQDSHSQNDS